MKQKSATQAPVASGPNGFGHSFTQCLVISLIAAMTLTIDACKKPDSGTPAATGTTLPAGDDSSTAAPSAKSPATMEPAAAPMFDAQLIALPGSIVVPASRDAAALPSGLIAPGDLNRDSSTDLVVLVDSEANVAAVTRQVVAYSGADHAILWSVDTPLATKKKIKGEETTERLKVSGLRCLPDVNDDDIPDIFVAGAGESPGFAVISGKDGSVIAMNASPKDKLIQLVDVREVTGDVHPDFIFATALEDASSDAGAERIGFAVYSGDHLQRAVSYRKPFGRMQSRQTLLYGPFPDSNGDKIDEILCYGVVPANRSRSDEAQFALVDGRQLKRWVLTRTEEDPTQTKPFMTSPGVVVADNFADLVISTPVDAAEHLPSSLGFYVLKKLKYQWLLKGNSLTPDMWKALGHANSSNTNADIQFGAPVVAIDDMDSDSHRDIATTVLDPKRSTSRRLVTISSATGRFIQVIDSESAFAKIEPMRDRVQMTAFHSKSGAGRQRIAISGRVSDKSRNSPAILLFDVGDESAPTQTIESAEP